MPKVILKIYLFVNSFFLHKNALLFSTKIQTFSTCWKHLHKNIQYNMPDLQKDLSQLCIHTITTKPWSLPEALEHYSARGVQGMSVWQNAIENIGAAKAGDLIKSHGIDVVSYVRGGFFPNLDVAERQKAIDHNKKMLDEAAAVGAPLLVLVCGAEPRQLLSESRKQIQESIEHLIPYAQSLGVKLGIEPLHPMYADTRSAINTLGQANDIAESVQSKSLGVAVDVYHLWWDDQLEAQIRRCGKNGNLFAYHICDWKIHPEDMLNDRGLMGEGCIPLKEIGRWVSEAGFKGYHEVEIFSNRYWRMDQSEFLDKIINAYLNYA